MKLYHHPLSSNARKAVMTALLLESPVELEIVDLTTGAQKKPDYLAINPSGKVPALVDDGFALSESHAIMQYLCDKAGGHSLYPSDLRARATVNQWLFWSSNHWSVAIAQLTFEHMLKKRFGMGDADPAMVARGEAFFHDFAKVLDAHLATRAWVAGDGLTIADLAIATPLMYIGPGKLPVSGYASIQSWLGKVQALDAWKRTNPPIP